VTVIAIGFLPLARRKIMDRRGGAINPLDRNVNRAAPVIA
jgi:hypothetical protein